MWRLSGVTTADSSSRSYSDRRSRRVCARSPAMLSTKGLASLLAWVDFRCHYQQAIGSIPGPGPQTRHPTSTRLGRLSALPWRRCNSRNLGTDSHLGCVYTHCSLEHLARPCTVIQQHPALVADTSTDVYSYCTTAALHVHRLSSVMQALHSTGEAQCGDTEDSEWGLEGSVKVADDLWVTSLLLEQHHTEQ